MLQVSWVQPHVLSESTRQIANLEPRSRLASSWLWSANSGRSSTCPLLSGPSSPALSAWPRRKLRSGSRTDGPKPSVCRRPRWRNSKWLPNPCCTPASRYRFPSALSRRPPRCSMDNQDSSPSTDTCSPCLRLGYTPRLWAIICIIFPEKESWGFLFLFKPRLALNQWCLNVFARVAEMKSERCLKCPEISRKAVCNLSKTLTKQMSSGASKKWFGETFPESTLFWRLCKFRCWIYWTAWLTFALGGLKMNSFRPDVVDFFHLHAFQNV